MRILLALLVFLFPTISKANDYRLLELNEFSFEAWRTGNLRDSYLPYLDPSSRDLGERWVGGTAVNFNLGIVSYGDFEIRWDNRVHMDGTNKQVRHVGWEYDFVLSYCQKIELFWYHHSRHIMEAIPPEGVKFPLTNSYGVRVIFYRR